MKKTIKPTLLALLCLFSCVNVCYADEINLNKVPNVTTPPVVTTTTVSTQNGIVPVATMVSQPPVLVAPVVEDSTLKKSEPSSKKIDLKAIIFDPNADFKAQATEENREMTKLEEAEYNLHEALHGEVQAVGTKGLLADQMKMNFKKGPIESISPWIDFNGSLSNIWTGDVYKNTTYGINFADIGINGKMRDGKTEFRFMISPVRSVEGNTYFNSFFADNYVTRKVGKHNKILVGNTWVPIGIEGKESPLVSQFFTRSQTSKTYGSVRALGTKVMGTYEFVDYHLGAYSSGRFFKDFFPGPEVAGWVDLKPLARTKGKYGNLTIGAGFDGGNAQSHYAIGTAAVNYEYKRLRAIVEGGMADGSNGATGFTANKSGGSNGTLAYRITPKLQALVRYDQFDPDTNKANDMRTEYTAGFNYFIKEQALKLMLNFVHYTVENGTFGDRIMVGTQIII